MAVGSVLGSWCLVFWCPYRLELSPSQHPGETPMTSTQTNTTTNTQIDTPDDLVTQEEAAAMFSRTKGTIRDWRRNGKIETHRRPDGMVYVSIADCNRHIAQITTIASRKERNPAKLIHNPVDGVGPTPTAAPRNNTHTHTHPTTPLTKFFTRFITNLQEQVETEREKSSVALAKKCSRGHC